MYKSKTKSSSASVLNYNSKQTLVYTDFNNGMIICVEKTWKIPTSRGMQQSEKATSATDIDRQRW